MPAALGQWFHQHYYIAILVATMIEGLGLPLPAETLFIAAGAVIHRGEASLSVVILLAALGNLAGSFVGFSVAYMGGKSLLARVARALRLKPEALEEVDRFFARYGAATVFMSRFVGFIRAATIYSSGAARLEPWRFVVYTFSAALIWNAGWAFLAYHFGTGLHRLAREIARSHLTWLIVLLIVAILGGMLVLFFKRRKPAGS